MQEAVEERAAAQRLAAAVSLGDLVLARRNQQVSQQLLHAILGWYVLAVVLYLAKR